MNRTHFATLIAFAWADIASPAADLVQLHSQHLGNGWFQYRVTLPDDSFYASASVGSISIPFTNRVSFGTNPPAWTPVTSEANSAIWNADQNTAQPRPYEAAFLVQSSHTTYKTVETGALVTYTATPQADLISTQFPAAAGFASLKAIVPCPPNEADGSPSATLSSLSLRQDMTLTNVTTANGALTGLSFSWNSDSTVQLQSSQNLANWTTITNLLGDSGATSWTPVNPIQGPNQFFRLLILATEKKPELQ